MCEQREEIRKFILDHDSLIITRDVTDNFHISNYKVSKIFRELEREKKIKTVGVGVWKVIERI